jgi:hypothetical protein
VDTHQVENHTPAARVQRFVRRNGNRKDRAIPLEPSLRRSDVSASDCDEVAHSFERRYGDLLERMKPDARRRI